MSRAAALDDPWGDKAYAAALASRPKHAVRDHLEALHTSSKLTGWFRKDREPEVLDVTPENVIAALNRAGIRPVLMGTYGIGGYRSEARATEDVDVLVTKRDVRKAVRVLEQEFPYLEIIDTAVVTRFRNAATQKTVLDVMKPDYESMRVVFRNTLIVGKTHRVPTLEMALVSKFLAITSPTRRPAKRLVDMGDFVDIVEHNRATLDLEKLQRLASRIQPQNGARILRTVEDIDASRPIRF
ncbi:MAG: nucleotidyltransferase family protein [Gemmataceae bacterium]|nr:nucleotidyltransferase family protein [Gemmataceae bacterium]